MANFRSAASPNPNCSQVRNVRPHIPPVFAKTKPTPVADGGIRFSPAGSVRAGSAVHWTAFTPCPSNPAVSQIKHSPPPKRGQAVFWRRRWDSNPRALSGKLISSYFDNSESLGIRWKTQNLLEPQNALFSGLLEPFPLKNTVKSGGSNKRLKRGFFGNLERIRRELSRWKRI